MAYLWPGLLGAQEMPGQELPPLEAPLPLQEQVMEPAEEFAVPAEEGEQPGLFSPESLRGSIDSAVDGQLEIADPSPADAINGHEVPVISRRRVILRALEKVTARITELEVGLDETVQFQSLEITLRSCNKRPPEESPETTAFLEIVDNKPNGEQERVFTGWMFASSPGLSALEHPVYDIWVIDCKISEPVLEEESE